MGQQPDTGPFLTMAIGEHRYNLYFPFSSLNIDDFFSILDYELMASSTDNLSVDDWRNAAPTDPSNLILYSKLHFLRDGTLIFKLKRDDHSIIQTVVYRREDNVRRPLHK